MRKLRSIIAAGVLAASLSVATAGPSAAADTVTGSLSYTSSPGEFIGQGETLALATPDILIGAASYGANSVDINAQTSDFRRAFSLHFAAPTGTTLGLGTYDDAVRFESDIAPGISIIANGSACNSQGSFTVLALSIGERGYVNHLRIQFAQNCLLDGIPGTLQGEVVYTAPPPAAPPIQFQSVITKMGPLKITDFGFGIQVQGRFRCSNDLPGGYVLGSIHFEQGQIRSGFGGIGGPCTTGWTTWTTYVNPGSMFNLTGMATAYVDFSVTDPIYPRGVEDHLTRQVPLVELLARR